MSQVAAAAVELGYECENFKAVLALPCMTCYRVRDFIRLDALALSVIATATWLAGWWLGVWVSVTAGIVSKRLNLSENFLDHLVGPSFKHLGPLLSTLYYMR